jgi:hypothetical protein
MKKIFKLFSMFLILSSMSAFAQDDELNKINIHGFLSQGFIWSTDNNYLAPTSKGSFEFNELGLSFSSQVTDNLRIGLQLFSRDLGGFGNNEIKIDWAFADYSYSDWLGFRAGKMKKPAGLYNETRDVDMLRTSILLPQGVYNDSWRDATLSVTGFGIYGTIDLSSAGAVNYQVQVGEATEINTNSSMNIVLEDAFFGTFSKYENNTSYVAQAIWETPLDGFRLGASWSKGGFAAYGKTGNNAVWQSRTIQAAQGIVAAYFPHLPLPTTYSEAQVYIDLVNMDIEQTVKDQTTSTISAEYTWDDLQLVGEYTFMSATQVSNLQPDPTTTEIVGYYGGISYDVSELISVGSYYSVNYPDNNDKDGKKVNAIRGEPVSNGWAKDLSLSVKFNLNQHWTLKAEGHLMDGTANLYPFDQENPNNVKKDWNLLLGKITYNF